MWRSTRIIRCGYSMIHKLGNCVDKKLQNHYNYILKKVEEDLKEITDVYIQESSDMEAIVKLRDEGKWPTGTNVVYEIDSLQGEELKKVETMARSAGLIVQEVKNWFEPEPEKGKRAEPGYVAKEGGYESADIGKGSTSN
ncbi:hypothetical protein L3X38_029721 [Prunus dulcis]|uniref:Uncharacterized protein n=1 Tax=Prunus dulcis TaxID=3755 RepID=A0AAD4Z2I0_PRUDU|nr:hypothetical protein L3X38_029719 [Prunus dulcis]KAI5330323.1 hypothetical protein L3X38_029721 [Prunus dulcis]